MKDDPDGLVNWRAVQRLRNGPGVDFDRVLAFFREDGFRSVATIETAVRAGNAAQLVMPAHSLQEGAQEFGAVPLCKLAEHIEIVARRCVEDRQTPDELIAVVVRLRPLFVATITLLDHETRPAVAQSHGPKTPAL